MTPFHALFCLLSLGLCPGEPDRQQAEPPAARPAKPLDPRLQALLDRIKEDDRQVAAFNATTARWDRDQKALADAHERNHARRDYESAAMSIVRLNASLNSEIRERTGLRLPSVKYWQLVSPRVDDPDAPQVIKDSNFLNDYAQFKYVLSDIKFEVSIEYMKWTGKWLRNPTFLDATLFKLPDAE